MPSSRHDSPRRGHNLAHHLSSPSLPADGPAMTSTSHSSTRPGVHTPLFVEDRKGDRQNLTYGSLDRHAIPRYRPAGHGALLGVDPRYRITSRSETRCEVENLEIDSARKTRKQNLLSKLAGDDGEPVGLHSSVNSEADLHKDFLRFEQARTGKRRRLSPQPEPQSSEEDYSDESNPNGQAEQHVEDTFDTFKKDPTHQRYLKLSRATVERPNDASAWLALIDYQDVYLSSQEAAQSFGTSSARSLADTKISLYEQALARVKDHEGRHALILGLMEQGKVFWDAEKQASKWRSLLNEDSSFDLWLLYVNFTQTNPVKFSLDECLEVYKRWLQKFQDFPADRTRDSRCIYIVLRATALLWEAGFSERAIGIWQGLLEYNLFRPPNWNPGDLMSSFQDFWSSEAARIGEEGSTGWQSRTRAEVDAKSDITFQTQNLSSLEQWATAELEAEKATAMPARSLDNVGEDDPYRILLFSDIQDFLFSAVTEHGLRMLEDAFFLFMGCPTVSLLSESRAWRGDPFIYSEFPAAAATLQLVDHADDNLGLSMHFRDVLLPLRAMTSSSPSALWSFSKSCAGARSDFCRRVISQLAGVFLYGRPDELMMEYAIFFEAGTDLKSARKLAKSFLRVTSDSLRLYDAYATLESQLGNLEAAERVWSTALAMRNSLNQDAESDAFLLWRNWVYTIMCQKKFCQARILLTMVKDTQIDLSRISGDTEINATPSIATQIKIEQYIRARIEACRSKGLWVALSALIDLLAFHLYLNNGRRLELALDIYQASLTSLANVSSMDFPLAEAVHEQQARFIHAHAVTFGSDFKPKDLSIILTNSARRYPGNALLLSFCHYFTQRSGLVDRLRQMDSRPGDEESRARTSSAVPCTMELLVELQRPAYSGSTNHSIRSVFNRVTALGSPGHDCVGLWRAFILWEVSQVPGNVRFGGKKPSDGKQQLDRAKLVTEALYAAFRACPWSKELCMLAFTEETLRNAIGNEDLKQVYQNMLDRGMRLRIDISDRLG